MEIRDITEDDYEAFRELRLEALQDAPAAFGSDYESEVVFSPEKFCRGLTPGDDFREAFVLGAWSDDGELIGMAGFNCSSRPKMKHKAWIWGMYVSPDHRSRGVGRLLMTSALERAREVDDLEQVQLSVVSTNQGARRLYEDLGFVEYGCEPSSLKVDGVNYDECFLCLRFPERS